MVPICLLLFFHASTNFLQLWIFFWQRHAETSLILAAGWQGMTWDCAVQKDCIQYFPAFSSSPFPITSPNASMDPSSEVCAGISTSHVRSRTGVNKLKDKSFEAQISQLSSTMLLPGPENWPLVQRWDSWRNSKCEWFLLNRFTKHTNRNLEKVRCLNLMKTIFANKAVFCMTSPHKGMQQFQLTSFQSPEARPWFLSKMQR